MPLSSVTAVPTSAPDASSTVTFTPTTGWLSVLPAASRCWSLTCTRIASPSAAADEVNPAIATSATSNPTSS